MSRSGGDVCSAQGETCVPLRGSCRVEPGNELARAGPVGSARRHGASPKAGPASGPSPCRTGPVTLSRPLALRVEGAAAGTLSFPPRLIFLVSFVDRPEVRPTRTYTPEYTARLRPLRRRPQHRHGGAAGRAKEPARVMIRHSRSCRIACSLPGLKFARKSEGGARRRAKELTRNPRRRRRSRPSCPRRCVAPASHSRLGRLQRACCRRGVALSAAIAPDTAECIRPRPTTLVSWDIKATARP